MRFKVVSTIVVLWVVTRYSLLCGYQRFGVSHRLHFYPEDGNDTFHRYVGNHLLHCIRRHNPEYHNEEN
jgi:hypothetical protein